VVVAGNRRGWGDALLVSGQYIPQRGRHYEDVGLRAVGQGVASKPFSSSDPWMSLTTLDFVMI
jgi:hypothetical protein